MCVCCINDSRAAFALYESERAGEDESSVPLCEKRARINRKGKREIG